jgi:hypothetical protein
MSVSRDEPDLHTLRQMTVHSIYPLPAGAMFASVVEVALAIPREYPNHKLLRARFISFLHRMVEGLQVCVAIAQYNPCTHTARCRHSKKLPCV